MRWRLGVVGSPIDHSRSPELHQAGLASVGLTGHSERIDVTLDEVDTFVARMGRDFDAVSVTMPLKAALATRCEWLDESAIRLGVVNSLRWHEGALQGRATDGPGFLNALFGEWHYDVMGRHVVVEGTGGSATAIIDALVHAGVARVSLVGRNDQARHALCAMYSGVVCDDRTDDHVDLVVTTTPAPGRSDPSMYAGVDHATRAVDITYNEPVSKWMKYYSAEGCAVMNGLPMLAYQAALQMSWWWGVPLDGAALMTVLR